MAMSFAIVGFFLFLCQRRMGLVEASFDILKKVATRKEGSPRIVCAAPDACHKSFDANNF